MTIHQRETVQNSLYEMGCYEVTTSSYHQQYLNNRHSRVVMYVIYKVLIDRLCKNQKSIQRRNKYKKRRLTECTIHFSIPSIPFVEAIAFQEENSQSLLEHYLS